MTQALPPKTTGFLLGAVMFALGLGLAADVRSQAYPSKPIRVVVPYPAGGNADNNIGKAAGSAPHQCQWTRWKALSHEAA